MARANKPLAKFDHKKLNLNKNGSGYIPIFKDYQYPVEIGLYYGEPIYLDKRGNGFVLFQKKRHSYPCLIKYSKAQAFKTINLQKFYEPHWNQWP